MKTEAEIQKCIERQKALCGNDYPMFAPSDGRCWSCNQQIYQDPDTDGSKFITGCPLCHRSYCD